MLLSDDLFPQILPAGVTYLPNYLSDSQERQLMARIEEGPWDLTYARRRKHYGAAYHSAGQMPPLPMPARLTALAVRLCKEGVLPYAPRSALINEYLPGQGIADHTDRADRPGGCVVSISMGSGAEMRFTEPCGRRHLIYLEPRSLILFQGAARDVWQHGIAGRYSDRHMGLNLPRERRVSITMRCGPDNPLAQS